MEVASDGLCHDGVGLVATGACVERRLARRASMSGQKQAGERQLAGIAREVKDQLHSNARHQHFKADNNNAAGNMQTVPDLKRMPVLLFSQDVLHMPGH